MSGLIKSDADKIKLGIAGALLVIGIFLIYWFALRSPPPDTLQQLQQSGEVQGGQRGLPPGTTP
ncbi:MAG: hypothetical protein KF864_09690 [Phycisphaeraceae bacterium]|nr:hypothetical protein [Phycisphaeraceae bacterium]MBX3410764.1 hypothetical protein [Phycisphaeraceae bacterium]